MSSVAAATRSAINPGLLVAGAASLVSGFLIQVSAPDLYYHALLCAPREQPTRPFLAIPDRDSMAS